MAFQLVQMIEGLPASIYADDIEDAEAHFNGLDAAPGAC